MSRRKHLWNQIFTAVGLPSESLPFKSLVEISDNDRILIENHKGVVLYTHEEIHIRLDKNMLCISGSDLLICYMSKERLVISGCINSVIFAKGSIHG